MSEAFLPTHDRAPRLGAYLSEDGVDVAVVASHATKVEFCAIDVTDGEVSERRFELPHRDWGVFSGHIPGIEAGQRYGFRVHGPWDPAKGRRHNPAKLLIDPYARGFAGDLVNAPETRDFVTPEVGKGDPFGEADPRDSAEFVPHSVIVEPLAAHENIHHPRVPWSETVVYEAHVKGFTQQFDAVPEPLRGTYAGMAHPAVIDHLKSLGVTTLELLPIHAFASETHLDHLGLANYWGYNTLGFFAPHPGYATAEAQAGGATAVLHEVRGMVHLLHEAGIEVVLDVVYNHTCEGGVDGPTLGWRGLDNEMYYLHDGGSPSRYADVTGTGNSLDFRRPRVVQLALDSLRYWVDEIGVDGFRFDLAVTLARGQDGFDRYHPFLVALQTDPVLAGTKFIAEPWDIGPGGWRTGQFPPPFAEWNDRFRDAVRGFWLHDLGAATHDGPTSGFRELATRLAGSADLFGMSDPPLLRGPVASMNYVTAHDGFTMRDLVSYNDKHNLANGEDNRDGTTNNLSWNHGAEGPVAAQSSSAEGADVSAARRKSLRNLWGMLLLSAGTPLITAGDEFGRTQRGNNNAYCQDNDISWVSWELGDWQRDLLATVRHLSALRRTHSALRVDNFFLGAPRDGEMPHQVDLTWYCAGGKTLTHQDWNSSELRSLQMLRRGVGDDAHVLLVINGSLDEISVSLAGQPVTVREWSLAWDSALERPSDIDSAAPGIPGGATVTVAPFSMQVYVAPSPDEAD
ncbi:glycogen debranching protein GlgX [Rarobacter faecitabidus]|uniref:Glycogen operon protein n=1 Tax=Rarobacter faecitabidus TaxID=13243 RepID=A0A542ZWZ1_RARFA|nr:glycogen debranching protein GlgX [Rarobacter faecitabidus]TQL64871.1 glycogen operon protein [Rarobacter faecitabidus]